MLKVVRCLDEWARIRQELTSSLGFVPTMGCLHAGHEALIKEAVSNNEKTVVSIYVNPTQFNSADDLEAYPRTEKQDIALLEDLGVDYVLMPESSAMYPEQNQTTLQTTHPLSTCLEGQYRPGHFNGVLAVVMKLLWLLRPTDIYFGDKDYQQCVLVRSMMDAYHVPATMHVVATQRDKSGLPLSSRLNRLDEAGLQKARVFASVFHAMQSETDFDAFKQDMEEVGVTIEYLEAMDNHLFVAAFVESVRLIDHKLWRQSC